MSHAYIAPLAAPALAPQGRTRIRVATQWPLKVSRRSVIRREANAALCLV